MPESGNPRDAGDRGPSRPKLCVVTMGCKVNRADSVSMARLAEARGYEITPTESGADLFLLNTCTVTARSDSETRQIIRRLHRASPSARIIVGGCMPRVASGPDPEFEGFCTFIKSADGREFEAALTSAGRSVVKSAAGTGGTGLLGRTRPFLKIQDGCNGACSYCIVPRARGRSRSIPFHEAVDGADALAGAGHREIVLVGIHLGTYGRDLDPPSTLAALLHGILSRTAVRDGSRIRLTSLEPLEVDGGLLEIISASGAVCRHLHVPLQSGCDRVLRGMNRPYDTAGYRVIAETIKTVLPDACLGADVISGFPGETDGDHAATMDFIRSLPLDYLHVFTFSPRPGTPAASMPGRPPAGEVKRRVAELRALGEHKRRLFQLSMVGRRLEAIVEDTNPGGGVNALTSNYIKVRLGGAGLKRGKMADIVIESVSREGIVRARKA